MTAASSSSPPPVQVAALYRFTRLTACASLRAPLLDLCRAQGIFGTLLLAPEGINGTVAGAPDAIAKLLAYIRTLPGCDTLDVKLSYAQTMPFHRMKVRLKREIVTMGAQDIDPLKSVGTYVEAQDWNSLIADPDTIVIDTRNDYEVAIGSFEKAINPKTKSFSEFPAWFKQQRDALLGSGKNPKIAMFCTGGIRCEKSTAFLKEQGIEEVYHLKGGILKYLETVAEEESLWRGACFVFDERVSVQHGLAQGPHSLCRACRRPLDDHDRQSPYYEEGVSCAQCYGEKTLAQRASFRERHRQEMLAAARGLSHIGTKQH